MQGINDIPRQKHSAGPRVVQQLRTVWFVMVRQRQKRSAAGGCDRCKLHGLTPNFKEARGLPSVTVVTEKRWQPKSPSFASGFA